MRKLLLELGYTMARKAVARSRLPAKKSRIMKAVGVGVVGLLILHCGLLLLAFCLYSYLVSLTLSPALAALGGGALFIVLALGAFGIACQLMKSSPARVIHTGERPVSDVVHAFIDGFTEHRHG